MFNEAAAARLTSACSTPGPALALSIFFFFPFFNDRCCVSATRGTHYVTFPAVSAAAVEAATAGTGIITGNTVLLVRPCLLFGSGESQCHWDSIFRDFIHDKANSFSRPTTWQHKSQSLTVFDHLTVTPASIQIKAGGKTKAAAARLNNIITSTFGNGQTGVFPGFVSEPTLRYVLTNVGLVCRELLQTFYSSHRVKPWSFMRWTLNQHSYCRRVFLFPPPDMAALQG